MAKRATSPQPVGRIDWPRVAQSMREARGGPDDGWVYLPMPVTSNVAQSLREGDYAKYGLEPDKIEVTVRRIDPAGRPHEGWQRTVWLRFIG